MLTPDDMKKLHDAVAAGKIKPTGLPLNWVRLELLRLMHNSRSHANPNGPQEMGVARAAAPRSDGSVP
jgi:hypothetical protein